MRSVITRPVSAMSDVCDCGNVTQKQGAESKEELRNHQDKLKLICLRTIFSYFSETHLRATVAQGVEWVLQCPSTLTPRLCLPSPWHQKCKTVVQKLSQDVNSFIYLSLLQSCRRANVRRGGKPRPHNQHHVGLYWCTVAAVAPPAPKTQGHAGAEGLATVHPRR